MGCICTRESVTVDGRRFHVRGRLGEGGFSYVDLVEDGSSHKKYALKRIVCHSETDQKVALAEVEYMRKLSHPNLLPLEAADIHQAHDKSRSAISEVLIVMPFYRRGTIHDEFDVLNAGGNHIDLPRVLRLFLGICEGVKALHTMKPSPLSHRDLKPANVLLTDDDVPVLMDFGSMGPARVEIKTRAEARQLQDLAAERCSMPYRPPELFNVESETVVDERVDIWSLGCTLYALCYHESPFDKTYQQGGSIALAVLGNNIKFPENDPYPSEVRDLIQYMLVINAADRPFINAVISRTETLQSTSSNRV